MKAQQHSQEMYNDTEVRLRMVENAIVDIKEILRKMDAKFDKVDERFDKVDDRFDKVDDRFNRIESKIDSNFKWLLSIVIGGIIANSAMFGTIALHSMKIT